MIKSNEPSEQIEPIKSLEEKIENEYFVSRYIIVYKFIFGLIEFSFGVSILLFGHKALILFNRYAQSELLEDPHDLLVNFLEKFVPYFFTHNIFLALYLVILGGAKIAGSIGLIYKKNWGVDLLVTLTLIMFPFQVVKLFSDHSIPEFIYLVVGVFIALYLINFKPDQWVKRVTKNIKSNQSK